MDELDGSATVIALPVAAQWSDWCLGDLSDALRTAVTALGASAPAGFVVVHPPTVGDPWPMVQVKVADLGELDGLRRSLHPEELLPEWADDQSPTSFMAQVDHVLIRVTTGSE
jgi:hypothetical protein